MGKETDPLKIRYMRTDRQTGAPIVRSFAIPPNYSCDAIKEILTGIVWGQDSRSIYYVPQDSNIEEPVMISDQELKGLRSVPKEDRLAQLDIYAMGLKASPHKILVELVR